MKTEHILIIRFSALGDVAMTVPVVSALAEQYPHVRITVLSKPFTRVFFEGLAPNVGFMGADVKGEYRGVKGLNALYRRLSAKHFTAIADLHNTLRSKYLRMRFNLGHNKVEHINKHKNGKRLLTSQCNKHLEQQPTSFENYADVFDRLGYPVRLDFQSMFASEGPDLSLLPEELRLKPAGEKWIGIAPFAAHCGKIYPIERMEEVVGRLSGQLQQSRLFLFGGGKEEKMLLDKWAGKYAKCTNASSLLGGLQQELVLMSQLDCMVSMDSANMHLASLVAVPVVSVWGATHPYAGFMGWQQKEENAVQVDLPCRPCSIYGKKKCHRGDYACLNEITPDMIVERVLHVVDGV